MANDKLTRAGIALLVAGVIMVITGLVLFFSVFFAGNRIINIGPSYFGEFNSGIGIPFERAVIGVILVGVGVLLGKIGLGMGIVGNADDISRWAGRVINQGKKSADDIFTHKNNPAEEIKCPECGHFLPGDSTFCNQCGTKIK